MAGSAFSAGGPGSPNENLNPVPEWELLSASTLLAQGHGLGFGLPPLTTPGLNTSRVDDGGVSRLDADSDAELGFVFRGKDGSSLPLDTSQIAVVCTTATSSVEPFTEGWKPQFRIAGAPLQENYYTRDPFASSSSNTGSSIEPFLDMEQSFCVETPIAADSEISKPLIVDKKPIFFRADHTGRRAVSPRQQERSKDDFFAQEDGVEIAVANSNVLDSSKPSDKNDCIAKSMQNWRKGQGFFQSKSCVTWSIALTTVLLGVFFITYCSQGEQADLVQELPTGDEVHKLLQSEVAGKHSL